MEELKVGDNVEYIKNGSIGCIKHMYEYENEMYAFVILFGGGHIGAKLSNLKKINKTLIK